MTGGDVQEAAEACAIMSESAAHAGAQVLAERQALRRDTPPPPPPPPQQQQREQQQQQRERDSPGGVGEVEVRRSVRVCRERDVAFKCCSPLSLLPHGTRQRSHLTILRH